MHSGDTLALLHTEKDETMKTTYAGPRHEHDAIHLSWGEVIHLSWGEVKSLLGHDHTGTPEDDEALVAYLQEAGAPPWIDDAEGWIDEDGWGLVGPSRHMLDA